MHAARVFAAPRVTSRHRYVVAALALAACGPGALRDDASVARDVALDAAHDAALDASLPALDASDAAREAALEAAALDAAAWTPDDPGIFVVVGYGGRRIRSVDDGATWTDDQQLEAMGGDDQMLLRTVLWGGDQFVALGWRAMTSADAHTWLDAMPALGQWIGAAVHAQGQYVSIGGYGWRRTSADGLHWTSHDVDTHVACHAHNGLVFGDVMGGRFAMRDDNGARFVSSDGVTWAPSTGGDASEDQLAFGNGVFVAVGAHLVVRSTDGGQTWSSAATLAGTVGGLVYAQGRFLALASGHAYTSSDGVTWADNASASVPQRSVVYGHGTYVAIAGQGMVRSTDGVHWTPSFMGTSGVNSFEWGAFGPAMP